METKKFGGLVKPTPEEFHQQATVSPKYTNNVAVEMQMLEDDHSVAQKYSLGVKTQRSLLEEVQRATVSNEGPRRMGNPEEERIKDLEK